MAASVRIEDDAFSDERYEDLALYAGLSDADHARGKMARLWRQCTIEQSYTLPISVVERVLGAGGAGHLVKARLGETAGDGLVRIRGTAGRVEWKAKLASASSKGGKARAKSASREGGRFTSHAAGALDQPKPGDVTSAPSPSPSPSPEISEERERVARVVLGDEIWARHQSMRERVHREEQLVGRLEPLHEQDQGRRDLSDRIRERGGDIDATRRTLAGALDVREAEARSTRSLANAGGGMWTAVRLEWATSRTVADVVSPQRTRRSSPARHRPETIEAAREVLAKITERTGADYADEPSALDLVADRLERGATAYDLRTVIAFCWEPVSDRCKGWGDDPKMRQHLTPRTLFSDEGWGNYWPPAKAWRDVAKPPKRADPDGERITIVRPHAADGGRR